MGSSDSDIVIGKLVQVGGGNRWLRLDVTGPKVSPNQCGNAHDRIRNVMSAAAVAAGRNPLLFD